MDQFKIAVLVGSLRADSLNARFATALARLAPPELSFQRVQIGDLPLYNQDDDENPAPPVIRLKSEVAAAQGVLFVTPEYNRSIPGVLKNAIDHGSRPYGHSVWAGKAAGIVGCRPALPAPRWLSSTCATFSLPSTCQHSGNPRSSCNTRKGFSAQMVHP
jgi:chromate reductase